MTTTGVDKSTYIFVARWPHVWYGAFSPVEPSDRITMWPLGQQGCLTWSGIFYCPRKVRQEPSRYGKVNVRGHNGAERGAICSVRCDGCIFSHKKKSDSMQLR